MSNQILLDLTPIPTINPAQLMMINDAWRVTAFQVGLAGLVIGLIIGIYFGYLYGRSK